MCGLLNEMINFNNSHAFSYYFLRMRIYFGCFSFICACALLINILFHYSANDIPSHRSKSNISEFVYKNMQLLCFVYSIILYQHPQKPCRNFSTKENDRIVSIDCT